MVAFGGGSWRKESGICGDAICDRMEREKKIEACVGSSSIRVRACYLLY